MINLAYFCFLFYAKRWFGIQLNPQFMGIDLKYVMFPSFSCLFLFDIDYCLLIVSHVKSILFLIV